MQHIAVVDDEPALRNNLKYALEKAGYRVSTHVNGLEAWEAFQGDPPNLYVLDILMPRMDGLEFCIKLRRINNKIPIIFLSSRDEELDRITGLETGGDDYIGKPFSVRELIARIKAVLRRISEADRDAQVVKAGSLSLYPGSYAADWDGEGIVFTVSEYRFLLALAESPGTVRSRKELYNLAFPEDVYINERAVDSHIKRIRRKLKMAGAAKNVLETVYGVGYRLGLE